MTVQTKSEAINRAIQLAAAKGYQVKEISDGWSGAEQVVYMAGRLTGSLRAEIETGIPELRYWKSERTPQNPADEGFISTAPLVGLSFPA
jgi:hypothetical protein